MDGRNVGQCRVDIASKADPVTARHLMWAPVTNARNWYMDDWLNWSVGPVALNALPDDARSDVFFPSKAIRCWILEENPHARTSR